MNSLPLSLQDTIQWGGATLQKGGIGNGLHDCICVTDGDGDDAARARNPLRKLCFVPDGMEQRTHSATYELGRGHRREWQQEAKHAVGTGGVRPPVRPASDAICNTPVTNFA